MYEKISKDSSLNFKIDRSIKYQNIIGFGGIEIM
jgi:hypothetical protein